jgi:hypothetical protein
MTYFLKKQPHDYDFLRWLVFTFAGGIIAAIVIGLVIQNFMIPITQFPSAPPPNVQLTNQQQLERLWYVTNFAISLGLYFIIPVILSLGLTVQQPKKQIVPPFFIQIIAYSVLAIIALASWNMEHIIMLLLFGLSYTTFVAPLQDKVVTMAVGLSGDASRMISYSLRANAPVEKILEILSDKKYRDRFRLDGTETKRIESGHWRLRSPNTAQFTTMLELKSDPSNEGKTIINLVFFFKERYSIERTTDLEEAARMRVLYLKEIITNDYLIEIEDRPAVFAKSLLRDAEDDIRGITKSFEKIPKAGWYQTIAFSIGMIIGIIASWYAGQEAIAIGLLAPFVAYLTFDIPRKLKGRD